MCEQRVTEPRALSRLLLKDDLLRVQRVGERTELCIGDGGRFSTIAVLETGAKLEFVGQLDTRPFLGNPHSRCVTCIAAATGEHSPQFKTEAGETFFLDDLADGQFCRVMDLRLVEGFGALEQGLRKAARSKPPC